MSSGDSINVFAALPAMDEFENLPLFLDCYRNQNWQNKKLVVCVNQPDNWWQRKDKQRICKNNQQSLEYLNSVADIDIEVIDKSSSGYGWSAKKFENFVARHFRIKLVKKIAPWTIVFCSSENS